MKAGVHVGMTGGLEGFLEMDTNFEFSYYLIPCFLAAIGFNTSHCEKKDEKSFLKKIKDDKIVAQIGDYKRAMISCMIKKIRGF